MPCSVRGCVHNRKTYTKGVKLFTIPSGRNDGGRRSAWINAIGRPDLINSTTSRVCELHFLPGDWEKLRQDGTRKLKATAVPSFNLHTINQRRAPSGNITNINRTPLSDPSPERIGAELPLKTTAVPSFNLHTINQRSAPSGNITNTNRTLHSDPSPVRIGAELPCHYVTQAMKTDHCYASSRLMHSRFQSLWSVNLNSGQPICSTLTTPKVTTPCFPTGTSVSSMDLQLPKPDQSISPKLESPMDLSPRATPVKQYPSTSSESQCSTQETLTDDHITKSFHPTEVQKENEMLRAKAASADKLIRQVFQLKRIVKREQKAKYRLQNQLHLLQRKVSHILSLDHLSKPLGAGSMHRIKQRKFLIPKHYSLYSVV